VAEQAELQAVADIADFSPKADLDVAKTIWDFALQLEELEEYEGIIFLRLMFTFS
jgi:hypothetical protein